MKKAESPTGSRKGFTLIETLVAVVILSTAVIFVAPALFKSGGILAYLTHRYEAEIFVHNLIAKKEEDLRSLRPIDRGTLRGSEILGGVAYMYELEVSPQDIAGNLYLLTVRVGWKDIKVNQIIRSACVLR